MAKTDIQQKINNTKELLRQTKAGAQPRRGPVEDSIRMVVPMMEDLLDLINDIVKELPDA